MLRHLLFFIIIWFQASKHEDCRQQLNVWKGWCSGKWPLWKDRPLKQTGSKVSISLWSQNQKKLLCEREIQVKIPSDAFRRAIKMTVDSTTVITKSNFPRRTNVHQTQTEDVMVLDEWKGRKVNCRMCCSSLNVLTVSATVKSLHWLLFHLPQTFTVLQT